MPDPYWKSSVWVVTIGYTALLLGFILAVAVYTAVILVLTVAALVIGWKIIEHLLGAHSDEQSSSPIEEQRRGVPNEAGIFRRDDIGADVRSHPATGVVQTNDNLFGVWTATSKRIDPETGAVQTNDNLLGVWTNSGERIDLETGLVQTNDNLLGAWTNSNERIDPQTGDVQTNDNALGVWANTGERVNPETGVRQKLGPLGWVDTDTRVKR